MLIAVSLDYYNKHREYLRSWIKSEDLWIADDRYIVPKPYILLTENVCWLITKSNKYRLVSNYSLSPREWIPKTVRFEETTR